MGRFKQGEKAGRQRAAYQLQTVDLRNHNVHIPGKMSQQHPTIYSTSEGEERLDTFAVPSEVLTSQDMHHLRRKYSSEKPPSGVLKLPHEQDGRSARLRKRTYTKVGGSLVNARGGNVPVVGDTEGFLTASLFDRSTVTDGSVSNRSSALDSSFSRTSATQSQDSYESEVVAGEERGRHVLPVSRDSRASRAVILQQAQQLLLARRGRPSRVLQLQQGQVVLREDENGMERYRSRGAWTEGTETVESEQDTPSPRIGHHPRVRPRIRQFVGFGMLQNSAESPTSEDLEGGDSLTDTEDETSLASDGRRLPIPSHWSPGRRAPPPGMPAHTNEWQGTEEPQNKLERQRGKLVTFFRNGDPFFRGLVLNINKRMYPNFETLLVDLTDKIPMVPAGVFRYVFRLPDKKLIKSVTEFERGRNYVVSKDKKFKDIKYGTGNDGWRQAARIERNDLELFKANVSAGDHPGDGKTRVLTITSNTNRSSVTKLLVNPTSSKQTFEDLLLDLASMVDVRHPPVTGLFTRESPQRKIASFSQLMREGKDTNDFLVCGTEQLPLEQLKRLPPNTVMSSGPRYGPPYPPPQPPRKVQSVQSLPSKLGQDEGYPPQQRRHPMAVTQGSISPMEGRRIGGPSGNNRMLYLPQYHRNSRDMVRTEVFGRTREFYAPSQHSVIDDGKSPDRRLRLDWVYGFRGRDVRQNLLVHVDTGEVVYFVAAVVVLYNKIYDTQRHYLGHTEEITCICLHPNLQWIASGQRSGETGAHVRVWDAGSLNTHHVIGLGIFQVGLASISFSTESGGELLVAVDKSKKHEMTVWDVAGEKLLAKTTTTTDQVHACSFYPQDDSILITIGKQHLFFWKIFWHNGRDMEAKVLRDKKSGIFQEEVPKQITVMCFSRAGEVITGDTSGSILVWTRDDKDVFTLSRDLGQPMEKTFMRPVTSLYFLKSGLLLAASGNMLRAYDSLSNYRKVKERVIPEGAGNIRSVCPRKDGEDEGLYIGTMGGSIVQGSLQHTFNYLVQGHSDAVWAVAAHPSEPSFITAGLDQYVIKWNTAGHAVIWRVMVEAPCTCIAINPRSRGGLVAMGTTCGVIILLNSYNGMHLSSMQISSVQLNCMAFSPDGETLAVGTHDGLVHTLEVQDDFRLFHKDTEHVRGNHSPITQLDWSSDGRYLQTVQADFELTFWETDRLQQVKNPRSMRDKDWYTISTTVGYNLTGPWENMTKSDVMTVVTRSNFRDLVITGDSRGHLRLYKYPCSASKPKFQGIAMYSDSITAAAFLEYDNHVVTAGGGDANLIQWTVINPTNQR